MPVISKPIDSACGSDNIRARIPCSSEHSEQSPTVKRGTQTRRIISQPPLGVGRVWGCYRGCVGSGVWLLNVGVCWVVLLPPRFLLDVITDSIA